MAGFTDLVLSAQPAIASVTVSATEGRTWRQEFTDITDEDGNDVDLTSATGDCKIITTAGGGTVVATLTFTGGVGSFTLDLDAASTAGLAGDGVRRQCKWSLTVTLAGESVQFWGPIDSSFIILTED